MKVDDIKRRLENCASLERHGLTMVYWPKVGELGVNDLVVFGAEQSSKDSRPRLIYGTGVLSDDPGALEGNTPIAIVNEYMANFLLALAEAGLAEESIHSSYYKTGRGKIWPTFWARLLQAEFARL